MHTHLFLRSFKFFFIITTYKWWFLFFFLLIRRYPANWGPTKYGYSTTLDMLGCSQWKLEIHIVWPHKQINLSFVGLIWFLYFPYRRNPNFNLKKKIQQLHISNLKLLIFFGFHIGKSMICHVICPWHEYLTLFTSNQIYLTLMDKFPEITWLGFGPRSISGQQKKNYNLSGPSDLATLCSC